MTNDTDSICAVATPAGKGGVGIIRVSGKAAFDLTKDLIHKTPITRYAHYGPIFQPNDEIIDTGITLFFKNPNSFTGEDVVEFQVHGGPLILDNLLKIILNKGIRLARPGEFTERAFLNNKIDLVQAEAIADLINSQSNQAMKLAQKSLQGEFSSLIHSLVDSIIKLRVFVESAIDFPEEEIDFLNTGEVKSKLTNIIDDISSVLIQAKQGSIYSEGITIAIAGEPNTGKSSLLNLLSGNDSAIVTSIAGTTRDVLKEEITIDGIPLHIVDTAGLRSSEDIVEIEGIERAWQQIKQADQIFLMVNCSEKIEIKENKIFKQFQQQLTKLDNISIINNKIDLTKLHAKIETDEQTKLKLINISVKNKLGIELLKQHIKDCAGFNTSIEGRFISRRRHLDALNRAKKSLLIGEKQLVDHHAGELLAEDLRNAQNCLSEITGEFSSDDLLGEVFSSFCIGK